MFQYGFCEDGNARDALLVDLGALGREARAGSREEAEFQARAERAQQLGVSLRCFLPASGVDWAEGKARGLPSEFVGALELMVGGSDVGAKGCARGVTGRPKSSRGRVVAPRDAVHGVRDAVRSAVRGVRDIVRSGTQGAVRLVHNSVCGVDGGARGTLGGVRDGVQSVVELLEPPTGRL